MFRDSEHLVCLEVDLPERPLEYDPRYMAVLQTGSGLVSSIQEIVVTEMACYIGMVYGLKCKKRVLSLLRGLIMVRENWT